MSEVVPLFDIPLEIGDPSSWKSVLICPKYLATIDNDLNLKIFCLETKKVIEKFENIFDFFWIESSFLKSHLLCLIKDSKLMILTTNKELPESIPFDPSTRKSPLILKEKKENFSLISEFSLLENTKFLTILEKNSFLLSQNDKIIKFTIYPDGLYQVGQTNSFSCLKFCFNGNFICSFNEKNIHTWNLTLSEHYSKEIIGTYLNPINESSFSLIHNSKSYIFSNTCELLKEIDILNNIFYLSIIKDEFFYLNSNFILLSNNFKCPLFIKDYTIFSFNNIQFLGNLINFLPKSFSIHFLSIWGRQSKEHSILFSDLVFNLESTEMIEIFTQDIDEEISLSFLKRLIFLIENNQKKSFAISISKYIYRLCSRNISLNNDLSKEFLAPLCTFRSIVQCPQLPPPFISPPEGLNNHPPISIKELLPFVLESLHRNVITASLPTLSKSFPDFSPFHLFRTVVLQQVWVYVCNGQIADASRLIEELRENPDFHFKEMWRQTTRNRVRSILYDLLHRKGILTQQDEEHHQILLKITTKYPNTSFSAAKRLNNSPAMKIIADSNKLPTWQPIVDLSADFNENRLMIFPELFLIPDEPAVDSPRYFLGNIALIEAQSKSTLKMLTSDGPSVERLWVLHCEHRVTEMATQFKKEIEQAKRDGKKNLKCIKFMNKYHLQMNAYEIETLLDVLCQNGFFAQYELDDFELLLVRICKNKFLFDQQWWNHCSLNFIKFFKQFAKFCDEKNLFMPFEMFVSSHPKSKDIDMNDFDGPLIKFIWDLWIKKDPASANISCLQYLSKSKSSDPIELWKDLPSDSLAPLSSFIWNKDPNKFKPGNIETEALSQRLKSDYPLLSSLVKGEIPHPPSPQLQPPVSKWRSPIFTSKFDLELHDLIASHFDYDFSKVFTDYYGKTPGQPPFPHFDHPELVATPSEPPYIHYIKSMLPVSAFQQACDDSVTEPKFKELCLQCLREGLLDESIRLSCLTFIELVDLKFETDLSLDYKLSLSIFDNLRNEPQNQIIDELSKIFVQKCKISAQSILKRLSPNKMELFLISSLLNVRCKLSIDYSPIIFFSQTSRPAELLLFIDRSSEIGCIYLIPEVVKIIKKEMPDHPLKDHLLFHLTQSLPAEEGNNTIDIPPALVVFRALRKLDQPPYISLLQEAITRKNPLYSILATSVEGNDLMICSLVTIMTISDSFSFDLLNPPPKDQLVNLYFQIIKSLLIQQKSKELLETLEIFSENSFLLYLVKFYHFVESFSFYRAELALKEISTILNQNDSFYKDDLLSNINISKFHELIEPLYDLLAKHCSNKSQIHLFRYLQLLRIITPSKSLIPLVEMSKIIENFDNFRSAIVECKLLGPYDDIVKTLTLSHSLALGQAVASVLGTSSASATQQWLKYQYSTASTPLEVLQIHSQVVSSIQDANRLFFLALFASLLPYSQPSEVIDILIFAQTRLNNDSELSNPIKALLLYIQICSENSLEVPQTSEEPATINETLNQLFPLITIENVNDLVSLHLDSPVLYGKNSLLKYFESSVDKVIEICLDSRRVDEARLICEWRNRDPKRVLLLESVQKCISGEILNQEEQLLLSSYGFTNDLEPLLDALAAKHGHRFVLISQHYKAAKRLGWNTKDLLNKKTTEFIESELSVQPNQWNLVSELISVGKLTETDIAECLSKSFCNLVIKTINSNYNLSDIYLTIDYSTKFEDFIKLSPNKQLLGDYLFLYAKDLQNKEKIEIIVKIILHSSFCTIDLDEYAELLDSILDILISENKLNVIIEIVTKFQDPALLPRYFQHLIAQKKLDAIPRNNNKKNVGRVIMNCARHVEPFEPQSYFDLTLEYSLYRDHGELQMEYGNRMLSNINDKHGLQEASKHFLLALAYFLHEKCYSLSMECLKKLSLISLQMDIGDNLNVLNLNNKEVLDLMKSKDFPYSLTLAVAYDLDTEDNWAESIYYQSIYKKGEDFLLAFQYFRPITTNLCDLIVNIYKNNIHDEEQIKRMKLFLNNIPNLVERYRISNQLNFQDQIETMKEKNPVVCEWCERVLFNDNK